MKPFGVSLCSLLAACFLSSSLFESATRADEKEAKGDDSAAESNEPDSVQIDFLIGGFGPGIFASQFNPQTQEMTPPEMVFELINPAFMYQHPRLPVIYVVRETMRNDEKSGPAAIFALKIGKDDSGKVTLTEMNRQPIDGDIPCFVSTDSEGKFALVANYVSGSIFVYPIEEDGKLKAASDQVQHKGRGPTERQDSPRAHSIITDPSNRWVLAADLGLDKVLVYSLDKESGKLAPSSSPFLTLAPGAGPRHMAFHPQGNFLFVINELNSTITAAQWDADEGSLTAVHTLRTLPEDFEGNNSTAEVLVHPNGKFVYGSNRGHDSIASFSFDSESGQLTATGHCQSGGKTPRNFRITPDGNFILAQNQQSDSVYVLKIDPDSGVPSLTSTSVSVPKPACIKFIRW